ncbi:MAG: transporter substrate-binding domain-containing protein [Bermanella sp.]
MLKHCVLGLFLWPVSFAVLAQDCTEIKVSGSNSWKPISFVNESKTEFSGVAFDVLLLLSQKLAIQVTPLIGLPWARAIIMMESGELDVMAGIYKTPERSKTFYFTQAFLAENLNIYVLRNKGFHYEEFKDLIGKRTDMIIGSSNGKQFDAFAKKHLSLHLVSTREQQFQRLVRERSDYVILDQYTANWKLKKLGLVKQIVALETPLIKNPIYFAFSKKSPCASLLPQINVILNTMERDGSLSDIYETYF